MSRGIVPEARKVGDRLGIGRAWAGIVYHSPPFLDMAVGAPRLWCQRWGFEGSEGDRRMSGISNLLIF